MNLSTLLNSSLSDLLGRRKREVEARVSEKPPVGTTLCCSGLRMTVQAGLSTDLWGWLIAQGWRALPAGDNRLRYRPLSTTLVTRLFDAQADDRSKLMASAIRHASGATGADASQIRQVERATL